MIAWGIVLAASVLAEAIAALNPAARKGFLIAQVISFVGLVATTLIELGR